MNALLQKIIIDPLDRFSERLLQFLPDILTALLILLSGMVLAIILKTITLRFFRVIRIDKIFERSGIIGLLQKGGIKEPASVLLSRLILWIIMLSFIIISFHSLNIPAVERILEKFILYLPNVFAAALILIAGLLLSNFMGRAALIASVNAGINISGLIGKIIKLSIVILSITMALEQLGIGRETIIIAFAVIFGGVVFALSLAFGLGGKDMAKEYLEKRLKEEDHKDTIDHL